jgi:hypothetical protein
MIWYTLGVARDGGFTCLVIRLRFLANHGAEFFRSESVDGGDGAHAQADLAHTLPVNEALELQLQASRRSPAGDGPFF